MSAHELEHRSADTNSHRNRIRGERYLNNGIESRAFIAPIVDACFSDISLLMGARELDLDAPCMSDGLLAKHLAVSILPLDCARRYHSHDPQRL